MIFLDFFGLLLFCPCFSISQFSFVSILRRVDAISKSNADPKQTGKNDGNKGHQLHGNGFLIKTGNGTAVGHAGEITTFAVTARRIKGIGTGLRHHAHVGKHGFDLVWPFQWKTTGQTH